MKTLYYSLKPVLLGGVLDYFVAEVLLTLRVADSILA